MARPSDYSPELGDRIAQLVRAGNYPERSAVATGVSARTFYRWMERGSKAEEADERGRRVRPAEQPYRQFWQSVKRAEAESEAIAVGNLMKAMPHSPSAVVNWLERRFRERWSRSEGRELSGTGSGAIESRVAVESPADRIMRKADQLHRRLLGIPDDWSAEQVRTLDYETFESERALVAVRLADGVRPQDER